METETLMKFEFGAMSSKYSCEAENKLTAYVAMVEFYSSNNFMIMLYEPKEIVKDDQWWSMDGKVAARLDEIFGGEGAFDKYAEDHLEEIKASYKSIKQLV